uniref:Peptidase A2 domain-containing protein n=1 Tax=Toxocara canis TaxID=6265 RepID=A0A183UTP6_TOXCA
LVAAVGVEGVVRNHRLASMKSAFVVLLVTLVAWVESMHHYVHPLAHRQPGRGGVFCHNRHDGRYAVGCVPEFVSCSAKVSVVMSCRRGLYFDEHARRCVPKLYASSCYGHGHPRPHHGYIPSLKLAEAEPVVYNFCAHRQDGDYSIGCTSCYISCSAKRPIAMECPAGLVLDEASDSCVGRAYAKVCGGIPTTTIPPPASEATTLRPYYKPCHHHHNGFFGIGCSSRYLACIDGRPTYHWCRHGLRFDERRQICAPETNTSVFASRYAYLRTQRNGESLSDFTGIVNRQHEMAEFNAITLEQMKCLVWIYGLHTIKDADIRTRAIRKIDGSPQATLEELSLEIQQFLNIKQDINGATLQMRLDTGADVTLLSVIRWIKISRPKLLPPPVKLKSANNKDIKCWEEVGATGLIVEYGGVRGQRIIGCSLNVMFVEERWSWFGDGFGKICCSRHTGKAAGEFVAWVESMHHYVHPLAHRQPGRGGVFCHNRHDGRYAVGCVPEFVSCSAKVSVVMSCRRGLYFDEHARRCVPKLYASSCYGHGHPRPHHGYIPSLKLAEAEPVVYNFCAHRQDGDYSIGCTSCYISCSAKRPIAMECPAGLVLDEASDSCVGRAYAKVCGGIPTTTIPPPASEATTLRPYYKPCHHHHNGFFGIGCSSRYLACIDGRPTYHWCRHGLRFDERRQICAPEHMVKPCVGLHGPAEHWED